MKNKYFVSIDCFTDPYYVPSIQIKRNWFIFSCIVKDYGLICNPVESTSEQLKEINRNIEKLERICKILNKCKQ